MSEPTTTDCRDVLEHLYAFHDDELSPEEADQIREHLMACEPCLDRFQVEDALRLLIRKCCSQARAPESLRVRVTTSYSHTVIVTGPAAGEND
jgi:anti-sigma factor (TIGR02949 family)